MLMAEYSPDRVDALRAAGVDNWEWYGVALADLPEDYTEEDWFWALAIGGVDNWDGFSHAVDLWHGGQDAEEDLDEEQVDANPVTTDSTPEPEPVPESQKLLLSLLDGDADKAADFWKRNSDQHTTAQFQKSLDVMVKGGTLEDSRMKLIQLVFKM